MLAASDWSDAELRCLGVRLATHSADAGGDLLVLMNAGSADSAFALPAAPAGCAWLRLIDTALALNAGVPNEP